MAPARRSPRSNTFAAARFIYRPAIISGIGALLGAAIGTKIALLINEDILKIMMLVALPCAAILLMLKKDFGKENDAPAREYTPQPGDDARRAHRFRHSAATTGSSARARARS